MKTMWIFGTVVVAVVVIAAIFMYSGQVGPGLPPARVLTLKDPVHGPILTDFEGRTLYVYQKDSVGLSNCNGDCLIEWVPYTVCGNIKMGLVPESLSPKVIIANYEQINFYDSPDLGTLDVTGGDQSSCKQATFRNHPLYRFNNDTMPGQFLGQNISGDWIIAYPSISALTTN